MQGEQKRYGPIEEDNKINKNAFTFKNPIKIFTAMKKLSIMCSVAAAIIFASCAREVDGGASKNSVDPNGVAYLSIELATRHATRASDEKTGSADESGLDKIYLVTFNSAGVVMGVPESKGEYYVFIDPKKESDPFNPAPAKIAAGSKGLIVIANPGNKLTDVIKGLNSASTYITFSNAIQTDGIGIREIADLTDTKRGFTMINAGDETDKKAGDKILFPFIGLDKKIVEAKDGMTIDEAKQLAAKNRVEVKLERLAAKIEVAANGAGIKAPTQASHPKADVVTMDAWTVDAVNMSFYPFAEKTILSVVHTANEKNDYVNNFYTKDPNFLSDPDKGYANGLKRTVIGDKGKPELPFGGYYGWKNKENTSPIYVIENTMDAAHQVYGSATRVIIRANYFPDGCEENKDWFSWGNVYYKSLADLQAAYNNTEAATPLREACDKFMESVRKANTNITAIDFKNLTQEDINDIENGGQIVKDGTNPVIRWFQKGRCYYSYEIRHNNDPAAESMSFGKYGVVRNNWYNLTLNSVKGPGTPWFPEALNPGPGEPDPKEPIDMQAGFLGVTLKVNNWVIWNTEINDVD